MQNRERLWTLVSLAAVGVILASGYAMWHHARMQPAGKLYVADTFGDDVGVIDIPTGKLRTLMPTGRLPHNFALTRDRNTLYVSEAGSQSVSMFDTRTDKPIQEHIVGPVPDIPPHRKIGLDKIAAANSCKVCHNQRPMGSFISGIKLSPDESQLWLTEMKTQKITIVDAKTLAPVRQVQVLNPEGTTPSNMVIHPITHDVWVLNRARPKGHKLEGAHHGPTDEFNHDGGPGTSYITVYSPDFSKVLGRIKVDYAVPYGAVFSPDGRELYVAYRSTNKVVAIDTEKLAVVRTFSVDESPVGLLLGPDDDTLMVACFYQTPSTVVFLDRHDGHIKHKLIVPSSATLLVRDPVNGLVYLTASGSNKLVEIDPWKPAVLRTFDAGAYPIDIQLVP